MIIKEREYKRCECCNARQMVFDELYGCDNCGKEEEKEQPNTLRATIFKKDDTGLAKELQFCSWECCINKLRRVECDYFISLPNLFFDERTPGMRAADFFALFDR